MDFRSKPDNTYIFKTSKKHLKKTSEKMTFGHLSDVFKTCVLSVKFKLNLILIVIIRQK